MAKRDYYEILGLSKTASQEEIKKAYKRLAKEFHPDCNPGDTTCENKFKEVNEAYAVLKDPEKRKEYDMFGQEPPPGAGQGGYGGWAPGQGGGRTYSWTGGRGAGAGGINFEDIFGGGGGGGGGIGDIFGEIFGGMGGGRRGPRVDFGGYGEPDYDVGPRPGRDVESEITIGFDEAMTGGARKFTLQRQGPCPTCAGSGKAKSGASRACSACGGQGKRQVANAGSNFTVVCQACGGTGKVYTDPCPTCRGAGVGGGAETISVKIPAGVKDGGRLRVPGKGEAGPDGTRGDLFLKIHVSPHPYYRREGDDLHLDLPVTVSEAALGAKIEVPTLTGKATLKVPAGTQSGAVLRMKGKGAPSPRGGAKGDLYVHVQVKVPKSPDKKTREILEELKQQEQDPREGMFS